MGESMKTKETSNRGKQTGKIMVEYLRGERGRQAEEEE